MIKRNIFVLMGITSVSLFCLAFNPYTLAEDVKLLANPEATSEVTKSATAEQSKVTVERGSVKNLADDGSPVFRRLEPGSKEAEEVDNLLGKPTSGSSLTPQNP